MTKFNCGHPFCVLSRTLLYFRTHVLLCVPKRKKTSTGDVKRHQTENPRRRPEMGNEFLFDLKFRARFSNSIWDIDLFVPRYNDVFVCHPKTGYNRQWYSFSITHRNLLTIAQMWWAEIKFGETVRTSHCQNVNRFRAALDDVDDKGLSHNRHCLLTTAVTRALSKEDIG